MKIERTKVVQIHYTLTDKDGNQIDTSRGAEPLEYMQGFGSIIPGLESQLEGKEPGDTFTAVIAPKDGYGEYDEQMVAKVPRSQFDAELPIEVGQQFQAESPAGAMTVRVTEVTDDMITVDANHELAGKELHFDIEVVSVRDATAEELEVTDSCGCGDSCSSGGCGGGCSGCSGCGGF
ncbi:MAG: peptidylprolyl isomerase [Treponema sp.]|nr:peptidylprolyl isomerase [Treponema sp.]